MILTLVGAGADDLANSSDWLCRGLHDSPSVDFAPAIAEVLAQVAKSPRPDPWGAFWARACLDGQDRAVGLCCYKSAPDEKRQVEIAYYTFPHREGSGVATAMVRALTERALPHVDHVIAHTLPVENASCAVLRRCDYAWMGEATDPEDGLVWRWQYPSPEAGPEAG